MFAYFFPPRLRQIKRQYILHCDSITPKTKQKIWKIHTPNQLISNLFYNIYLYKFCKKKIKNNCNNKNVTNSKHKQTVKILIKYSATAKKKK